MAGIWVIADGSRCWRESHVHVAVGAGPPAANGAELGPEEPDNGLVMMTDRPLRFCMITTFYPPYNFGGDGIFVHQLSNELAQRGHQVEVIHCIDAYRLLTRQEPAGTYDDHPKVTVHG